jgi:hypothetical protein
MDGAKMRQVGKILEHFPLDFVGQDSFFEACFVPGETKITVHDVEYSDSNISL